eukprot:6398718-Amphidinium_carterae.2
MYQHWVSNPEALPFKPTSCLKLLGTEIHLQGSCRFEQSAYKAKHIKALLRLQRVAGVPTTLFACYSCHDGCGDLSCLLPSVAIVDVRTKFRTALLKAYMGKVKSVAAAP